MAKANAARTQVDLPPPMSFEEIWALLQESAKQHKEIDKQQKETDRKMRETDRIVKENARLIGNLGSRYGEMIEYMVKPNLVRKFRKLGFKFTKVYPETSIKDETNNIITEVDLTLEDGGTVMLVEVKSKPSIADIKDHIERMGKMRRHADLHGDTRAYLGAVAGMVIKDNVRGFILKSGFYMIEPSGETFIITPPDGAPKEW